MQTSTDDVMVALVAAFPDLIFSRKNDTSSMDQISIIDRIRQVTLKAGGMHRNEITRYADIGCGVGSTLLLVANALKPSLYSVGIEAQVQSVNLLRRSLKELPDTAPLIYGIHGDVRDFLKSSTPYLYEDSYFSNKMSNNFNADIASKIRNSCDLVTSNPPYSPLKSGILCKDAQRRAARFEFRGGIEEFTLSAKELLSPSGRFVFAFWHRDVLKDRPDRAVAAAGLVIQRRLDVIMGSPGETKPHLSVFDVCKPDAPSITESGKDNLNPHEVEVRRIDITRDATTGGFCEEYKAIRRLLAMAPRPLKMRVAT
jgi:SAM-dependent methyltransferase